MDKLITFAIPSYNSAEFMHNCINSLLGVGDDVEIIIINDGSRDDTGKVADSFQEKYPHIIRAVHQENGGHGSGVNKGLELADGKYYKVVDSDDRLDTEELKKLLERLRQDEERGEAIDMYVCNYVYVRIDSGDRRIMSYKKNFPLEKACTWDNVRPLGPTSYLMMHSVIYRTELLREHNITLPHHTFYVDNLYMYAPFPYIKKIKYFDLNLYLYYVGSDEQSVSEKNVIRRLDQQLLVTRLVIDSHDLQKIKLRSKRLYKYMIHELSILMDICTVFSYIKGGDEDIAKIEELWQYLKKKDIKTYRALLCKITCALCRLPGPAGRKLTVAMFRVVNKIFNVN